MKASWRGMSIPRTVKLFPAGSHVRLAVDHMEKRRRIPNDHWPWVVKAFTPRHENYPVFKTATVSGANGESALQVSLISISRKREMFTLRRRRKDRGSRPDETGAVEVSKSGGMYGPTKLAAPMMVLEAFGVEDGEAVFRVPTATSADPICQPGDASGRAPPARFFFWAMSAHPRASPAIWCRRV